jgi:hypothetical protein
MLWCCAGWSSCARRRQSRLGIVSPHSERSSGGAGFDHRRVAMHLTGCGRRRSEEGLWRSRTTPLCLTRRCRATRARRRCRRRWPCRRTCPRRSTSSCARSPSPRGTRSCCPRARGGCSRRRAGPRSSSSSTRCASSSSSSLSPPVSAPRLADLARC